MRWLIFLFLTVFGCTETGIVKHTVEEKYIYPSYYDVYVEDSGLVIQDTADEEQFPSHDRKSLHHRMYTIKNICLFIIHRARRVNNPNNINTVKFRWLSN